MIRGLKLEKFVHGDDIPPLYAADKENEITNIENRKYTNYVQKYQLLVDVLIDLDEDGGIEVFSSHLEDT